MGLTARTSFVGLAASASLLAAGTAALAQGAPAMPGRAIFDTGQPGLGDIDRRSRSQLADRGNRYYEPLTIGSWLFSPSLDAGVMFDDNVHQARFNRVSSWAVRLQPRFVAARDTGLHATTAYGLLDGRFYPDDTRANTVNGRLGLTHRYEIMRDLVWRFQADFTRRSEDQGQDQFFDNVGLAPVYLDPREVNELFGSTSIQKTWGRFFAGVGGAVLSTTYGDTRDTLGNPSRQDSRNGRVYRALGRAGYEISPALYAFVEPSVDWWNYNASILDSTGYRIVGGLGSHRISLFKGEVFAGYQEQDFDHSSFRTVGGGVFGGRVSWFPTRDLTLTVAADRALGVSQPSASAFTIPDVTTTTSVGLHAQWLAMRHITASARIGYQTIQYETSTREDDVLRAGVGVTYMITPRLGVTTDYAYSQVESNIPEESYNRNQVTIGMRVQF